MFRKYRSDADIRRECAEIRAHRDAVEARALARMTRLSNAAWLSYAAERGLVATAEARARMITLRARIDDYARCTGDYFGDTADRAEYAHLYDVWGPLNYTTTLSPTFKYVQHAA